MQTAIILRKYNNVSELLNECGETHHFQFLLIQIHIIFLSKSVAKKKTPFSKIINKTFSLLTYTIHFMKLDDIVLGQASAELRNGFFSYPTLIQYFV